MLGCGGWIFHYDGYGGNRGYWAGLRCCRRNCRRGFVPVARTERAGRKQNGNHYPYGPDSRESTHDRDYGQASLIRYGTAADSSGFDDPIFTDKKFFQPRCAFEFTLRLEPDGNHVVGVGLLFEFDGENQGSLPICSAYRAAYRIGGTERQGPSLRWGNVGVRCP